ncbi:hypothetical protein BD626DRAFT_275474 [Schizophyllum amplum]|uniref:Uncharacterized protein n=1 Tax=Schizophyllum amplum TaxID=97359 RepID=A0A550CFW8_9AGAR|nr:hypothetical protein BD626DRAFT_275474 [Auriculariopsis ampla]
MQKSRRHTVYDLTALNLHEDGSRLDLDGQLTSRRAFAQRSRAVRDARGNIIARSVPIVPKVKRIEIDDDGAEHISLDDEEGPADGMNDEENIFGPSRKRRRLHQVDSDNLDFGDSPSNDDLPSGDLLKCIHHFASKYYTERGMLLNSSKDYRRERKERQQSRLQEETPIDESVDDDQSAPPGKRRDRGKAYAESSKQTRDMYKVMDGSALMALGLLLQEHVARTMDLFPPDAGPDEPLDVGKETRESDKEDMPGTLDGQPEEAGLDALQIM